MEEDPQVGELRKWIADYHVNQAQEPYFYSVRKICPADIARESQRTKKNVHFIVTVLVCIAISGVVFLKTRTYFENAWKACQVIADKKEYVIKNRFTLYGFERYATAQDIWDQHPTAGAPFLLFFRNVFCFLLPWIGVIAGAALTQEGQGRRSYHLIIDRTKDERKCPPNFNIEQDRDPLTQYEIKVQKLHSPQMIYLPNYVTDAKSFVAAVLIAGNEDFSDPVYRGKFTEQQRKGILSQIERIFLISEKKFNECFEKGNNWELFLDFVDPYRDLKDKRIFDATGHLSRDAQQSLQDVFNQDIALIDAQTNNYVDQFILPQHREVERRAIYVNALQMTGYIAALRNEDRAEARVKFFEMETGLSLINRDE